MQNPYVYNPHNKPQERTQKPQPKPVSQSLARQHQLQVAPPHGCAWRRLSLGFRVRESEGSEVRVCSFSGGLALGPWGPLLRLRSELQALIRESFRLQGPAVEIAQTALRSIIRSPTSSCVEQWSVLLWQGYRHRDTQSMTLLWIKSRKPLHLGVVFCGL